MKWRGEGWDWETISHKTGVPVNSLYPYTNYSKLDPDILYYAKNYPKKVTVNVITQLARLISADKPADQVLSICKSFVEDDASIVYGCTDVKTNLALLKAARAAHPPEL